MTKELAQQKEVTLLSLWAQFLPLSLSDITMALGDPLVNTTIAHLPDARANLAAVGVAKSQAVFFESPIIMLLHASNALAGSSTSRKALFRFTLYATLVLVVLMALLSFKPIFDAVGVGLLGVEPHLAEKARKVLLIMALWPAAIGWRRFFQGILIHNGHGKDIGKASLYRVLVVSGVLFIGYKLGLSGALLAGVALILGVLAEALFVLVSAQRLHLLHAPPAHPSISMESSNRPKTLKEVLKFYWPLGNSMMVVWGGRALLVGIVARAMDGAIALAAWPAAWGLVLLIANATRMVQQIVIRHLDSVSPMKLVNFAFSVGAVCSAFIVILALTPIGRGIVSLFLGGDAELVMAVLPVLSICIGIPAMVALQNAMQGFLIGNGRTLHVNVSTWAGTFTLLFVAYACVHYQWPGASAAAIAMSFAIGIELVWLMFGCARTRQSVLTRFLASPVIKN